MGRRGFSGSGTSGGGGGGAPSGPAGGDLGGSYPDPTTTNITGIAGTATISATTLRKATAGQSLAVVTTDAPGATSGGITVITGSGDTAGDIQISANDGTLNGGNLGLQAGAGPTSNGNLVFSAGSVAVGMATALLDGNVPELDITVSNAAGLTSELTINGATNSLSYSSSTQTVGNGGSVVIQAQASADAAGIGGAASFIAANGDGGGGEVLIRAGTGTTDPANGGAASLLAGTGNNNSTGGSAEVRAGSGNNGGTLTLASGGANVDAGSVNITAGSAGVNGGALTLASGGGGSNAGAVNITAGSGTVGGTVSITSGNGTTPGDIEIASQGFLEATTSGRARVNGDSRLDLTAGSGSGAQINVNIGSNTLLFDNDTQDISLTSVNTITIGAQSSTLAMQNGFTLTADDALTANIGSTVDIQSINDVAKLRATGGSVIVPGAENAALVLSTAAINDNCGGIQLHVGTSFQTPGDLEVFAGEATNAGQVAGKVHIKGGHNADGVSGGEIIAETQNGGAITVRASGAIDIETLNDTGPSANITIQTDSSGGNSGTIALITGSAAIPGDVSVTSAGAFNVNATAASTIGSVAGVTVSSGQTIALNGLLGVTMNDTSFNSFGMVAGSGFSLSGGGASQGVSLTAGSSAFVQLQGGTIQLNPTAGGALMTMNSFGAVSITSGSGQPVTITPDTNLHVLGPIISNSSISCSSTSTFSNGLTSLGNPVYGASGTFERSETGSDANVYTYTAGGADQFVVLNMAMDVSAITGTSIVVSVAWKDSNNTSRTSTLATVTATGGADVSFPLNVKAGQTVVVSSVFVGASTAYKISAFVQRLA